MKKKYSNIMLTMALATLLAANATAQETEVTSKYIKNPSFEVNGTTNWTQTNFQTQTNTSFTKKAGSTYIEKWVSGSNVGSATVTQTISGLPAGNYKLVVAAQNLLQSDETAAQKGAYIFARTNQTTVTAPDDYTVEFITLDGEVEIGFRAVGATGNWLAVDNFRLYYTGTDAAPLFEELQTLIATAESTLKKQMQSKFLTALQTALDAAKAVTADASAADIETAGKNLSKANADATANNITYLNLKTLSSKAKSMLNKNMAAYAKTALQTAYDAAQALLNETSDEDIDVVFNRLQTAYDEASDSSTAYSNLRKAISTANNLLKVNKDKEGAEEFQASIDTAQAILDDENATPAVMNAATATLEEETLRFRVKNATGQEPTVTTLGVIQGSTVIFGRASFSGSTRESGFCYSENPEPTIFDNRTTTAYTNNGAIYYMENVKPATVYYVRAYAISSTYKVGYGATVKVATLPKGTITWSYDDGGDATINARIRGAIADAVNTWNSVSAIKGFAPSVHYSPGTPTADCSYGGWMRMGANPSYQRTGTIMHEMAHGIGVGTQNNWWSPTYRSNGDRGTWLGDRVDRVVKFLENNANAVLNGDNTHMWPYGINGAHEDTGARMLYYGNGLIVEALGEDNLPPTSGAFATPAYTFEQDDEAKYYIKNESLGLTTSFLREGTSNRLIWAESTFSEAYANDSCAWYIRYNPATCYYTLKNAATGHVVSYSTTGANGFRLVAAANNTTNLQLMAARNYVTSGTYTFSGKSYWLLSSQSHAGITATANGATSAANFNHANTATAQRWLLLTADEAAAFAEANGETTGIRQTTAEPAVRSLNVIGGQGKAEVRAIGGGQEVRISAPDGRLIRRLYVQNDATATISLPRGLYLVNGSKVVVK